MSTRATLAAQKLLEECGLCEPLELSLEVIVRSKNVILQEEEIDGADGRILMNDDLAVITIDSNIKFESKRRFVIAHELGHFLLHRGHNKLFKDDNESLNYWYQNNSNSVEVEANEFAAELLMPAKLFYNKCKGKQFGPEIIDNLAERFQVSKTASILRFVQKGNYPVCVIYCTDNKMKWWKKSEDFRYYLQFNYNSPPPSGSVVEELFTQNTHYFEDERKQQVLKSTWFDLGYEEQDVFVYEFCLHAKSYNYSLSVIWED